MKITTQRAPPPARPPAKRRLSEHWLADLRASGLDDETIAESGMYSEASGRDLSKLLNWRYPADKLGESLVIPFPLLDGGGFNGFCRVKPKNPRKDGGKYEQPAGAGNRTYWTQQFIRTRNDATARKLAVIVEGEKKSLAIAQCGYAAVGLTGVENGFATRERDASKKPIGQRELLPELAAVGWRGWTVVIVFDTDPRRNPNVNLARSEMARLLTEAGARVVLVDLPTGLIGADGRPGKMGADDFIVAYGADAFRAIIERAIAPATAPRELADYRGDLLRLRLESVGVAGVNLDCSPTGSGKTTADIRAAAEAGKSLCLLPTHANCAEIEKAMQASEMSAAAYPALTARTCQNHAVAERALKAGLSVSAAVCPTCPHRDCCDYQDSMRDADGAQHRIATHYRASLGFDSLAEGRRYVAIHEDVVPLLRPCLEIKAGLDAVRDVAEAARHATMDFAIGEAGYYHAMEQVCRVLSDRLANAPVTASLAMPATAAKPRDVDAELHRAMQARGIWPDGDALRVVRAAAAGELAELAVRVDHVFAKGGAETVRRSIIAVWATTLPIKATVWLCDATGDPALIERIIGRPLTNATRGGTIAARHGIVQVPLDVAKSTAPAAVVKTLRGIMATTTASRIGIICDKRHVPVIRGTGTSANLDTDLRARITKVEHFRGGEGRSSNTWTDECDLLIVLGTPRVPPAAIEQYLIRTGQLTAAARGAKLAEWGPDYWSAITTSGRRLTVRTRAYRDRAWHAAHRAIVHAEILQCVGRARAICDHGIPAIVVTTEDLGLTVADEAPEKVSDSAMEVLSRLGELTAVFPKGADAENTPGATAVFPKYIYLGNTAVSSQRAEGVFSRDLATVCGIKERRVRDVLRELETAGLVRRIGQRGGWLPINRPTAETLQPPPPAAVPPPREQEAFTLPTWAEIATPAEIERAMNYAGRVQPPVAAPAESTADTRPAIGEPPADAAPPCTTPVLLPKNHAKRVSQGVSKK